MTAPALVRALRPRQWSKNLLVLAAPAAGGVLLDGPVLWRTLAAFAIFCAVSSATYLVNDVLDVEADRHHPRKRTRPIAAGEVGVPTALAASAALALGAFAAAAAVGRALLIVTLLYVAVSVAYSLWVKHVAVLDLGAVAGLFMIRAIAGGAATGVYLTSWFLVVTSFAALFIVTGKRISEISVHEEAGLESKRAVLAEMPRGVLQQISTISATITIAAYALWAFQRAYGSDLHSILFHVSAVPFTLVFLRYLLLVHRGDAEAPEHAVTSDRVLLALVAVWVATFAAAVYIA